MRRLAILLSVLIGVLAASGATAQQSPPAPATQSPSPGVSTQGMTARPAAPTGHRQPRMSDLPPDLAKKESGQKSDTEESNSTIDESLRICRGC